MSEPHQKQLSRRLALAIWGVEEAQVVAQCRLSELPTAMPAVSPPRPRRPHASPSRPGPVPRVPTYLCPGEIVSFLI